MAVKEKLQIIPHFIRWKPARVKAAFQKKFIMEQFITLYSFHQKKKSQSALNYFQFVCYWINPGTRTVPAAPQN